MPNWNTSSRMAQGNNREIKIPDSVNDSSSFVKVKYSVNLGRLLNWIHLCLFRVCLKTFFVHDYKRHFFFPSENYDFLHNTDIYSSYFVSKKKDNFFELLNPFYLWSSLRKSIGPL